MVSCVLFQNSSQSIMVVDLPRSIEECQVRPGQTPDRSLILEAAPPKVPFPTPESRNGGERRQASLPHSALLADLMTAETVKNALREARAEYPGPWTLPRVCTGIEEPTGDTAAEKDKGANTEEKALPLKEYYIPPDSHYLVGSIQDTRDQFLKTAPLFDLIVIDPPWPNRSAKRKRNNYASLLGLEEARALLELIPVPANLSAKGLVAVWVTNSPGVYNLLTGPRGTLSSWSLEVVAEWTWLKVTASGEPIFDIQSERRKPWEKIIIAKLKGAVLDFKVENKIIISVPDIHSRKPHLRTLFESMLGQGYKGLEVFARNLTAKWWSWGDEVLKFQYRKYWTSVHSQPNEEGD